MLEMLDLIIILYVGIGFSIFTILFTSINEKWTSDQSLAVGAFWPIWLLVVTLKEMKRIWSQSND